MDSKGANTEPPRFRKDVRFRRIEEIYKKTLERSEEERTAFLAEACAGDDDLRREVEKLLSLDKEAGSFMESPALDVAARALARKAEPGRKLDFLGQTILHYRVLEKVGEGGMGIVYKALDTHLQRPVAIKVLPPEIVADRERRLRFVQEARAASALNHPNIITIYDIDQSEGADFIAMEYVTGKTLAELIPRKGMKLTDSLKHSIQIADALAAAHAAGIVHRDLKPANVMVTEKGLVKVLDFGLAKLTERAEPDTSATTETLEPQTEEGTIVGTVAYMSPEQAEGKKVDARSDIFSLGSVLYEMVTGQKAFQGTSKMSTLSAILHQEPKPVSGITPIIPAELERLINRCLRKDPERRIQHMDDVKLALLELKEDSDSGRLQAAPARTKQSAPRLLVLGAVAFVALAAIGWYWWNNQRPGESEAPMVPVPFTTYPGAQAHPSFSPDGSSVAFQRRLEGMELNWDIWIKQIGSESVRQLTTDPKDDRNPAWSPDGQSIAFLRDMGDGKTLVMIVPANGGREQRIAELRAQNICWHPGGQWLAVACDQDTAEGPLAIFLLSPQTHERRRLTSPPKGVRRDADPAFSPDGRKLAFSRHAAPGTSEIYVVAVSAELLPEGEPRQLTSDGKLALRPAWTPDGKEIVYSLGGSHSRSLWRISISGSAKPKPLPFTGGDAPAISLNGHRLVYGILEEECNIWRCQIPKGAESPGPPSRLIASTQIKHVPQFSTDGKEIAYVSWDSGNPEIWICDSNGSNPLQLTHLIGPEPHGPRWSPDGQQIVFGMTAGKQSEIYLIPAQGGQPRQLTNTPYNEASPSFSRDGKWIYFASHRSGDGQVWKMPTEGGEQVQVTRKGGDNPQESMDGKSLFYLKGVQEDVSDLWKVPVDGGEESRVLEGVAYVQFDVKEHGVYYAESKYPEEILPGIRARFLFYSFADEKAKPVAMIRRWVANGFSASPDEHWILYAQWEGGWPSNLMLVENFR